MRWGKCTKVPGPRLHMGRNAGEHQSSNHPWLYLVFCLSLMSSGISAFFSMLKVLSAIYPLSLWLHSGVTSSS